MRSRSNDPTLSLVNLTPRFNPGLPERSITTLDNASSKGTYIQSISMSSTMSPGIKIDCKQIN